MTLQRSSLVHVRRKGGQIALGPVASFARICFKLENLKPKVYYTNFVSIQKFSARFARTVKLKYFSFVPFHVQSECLNPKSWVRYSEDETCFEICFYHFWANFSNRPGILAFRVAIRTNPGTFRKIGSKVATKKFGATLFSRNFRIENLFVAIFTRFRTKHGQTDGAISSRVEFCFRYA